MKDTKVKTISISDFGEYAYMAICTIQNHLKENSAAKDGNGFSMISPVRMNLRVLGSNITVFVELDMSTTRLPLDLSWMAFKAYSYALYTGARDLMIKNNAVPNGRRREIPVGSEMVTTATIGDVVISVLLRVEEVA